MAGALLMVADVVGRIEVDARARGRVVRIRRDIVSSVVVLFAEVERDVKWRRSGL